MIGVTTTIVTVMRIEVAVCAVARVAAIDVDDVVVLTRAFSELA
jgi:hypothetical protein